jgi:hypothetical protein
MPGNAADAGTRMTSGPRYLLSLLCVLAAIALPLLIAGLNADGPQPQGSNGLTAEDLAAKAPGIAHQVEQLRDLRFGREPSTRIVGAGKLRRDYQRQLGRHAAQLAAAEDAYKVLGIVEPEESFADLGAGVAAQVAGFYDPKSKRLFIVRSPFSEGGASAEITLAHELDHALEDQHFGIDLDTDELSDDRGLAATALIEGSATELEFAYSLQYIHLDALRRIAKQADKAISASEGKLPKAFEAEENFPYTRGRIFVASLLRSGSGWNLVNIALRERPPLSTEQILHPFKYLSYERPLPVRLHQGDALAADWRHLAGGDIGEYETYLMLRPALGAKGARRAAAGWGGQRLQLWRRGRGPCSAPCRGRDALFGTWRWDSDADARQFDRAMRAYIEARLDGKPAGSGVWELEKGWVALRAAPRRTTIAFAPRAAPARQLTAGG